LEDERGIHSILYNRNEEFSSNTKCASNRLSWSAGMTLGYVIRGFEFKLILPTNEI